MGRRQNIDGNLALDSKKVIVIEATKRPAAQKLRVAAYCRVSSDSSDQMNSFAAQLNHEKESAGTGGDNRRWLQSAISYILSNERYIGDSLWQKTYATDTLPARQVRNHGERQKYYVEDTHQPIIEKEIFRAVQELRAQRGEKYNCNNPRQENPLHGIIHCGECGSPFRRKICRGNTYWVCHNHDNSKKNCSMSQISEGQIHASFLRLYHKLRLHGEPILKQMISDLQSVRERRMLWSLDIIELNKRISDINDQERMLADMNKCGLVDPDIFIVRSNLLAQQLRAAKREKERILGAEQDDTIPKTRELIELLETLPAFLPDFDGEIFTDLVAGITAGPGNTLRFRLKNGLELTETIERSMR